jgi:hypothetical protein
MLKRWKRIVLILAALVALAQLPFIYRRVQIGNLSQRIARLNVNRTPLESPRYRDLAGVIHVHTVLGGHSTATFEELIQGSRGLDFVILTEHTADLIDTAAMTLNGTYGGVLFVGGNELDTASGDRMLLIPGTAEAFERRMTMTPAFLAPFQKEGRLAFVTYPERFTTWYSTFDGVEVFNLNTNSKKMNYPLFFLDALWSYGKYPELTLAGHLSRPDENLQKFDEVARKRRITLFAGSDAHSNLGFHLFGDDAGNKHLGLKFDSYATIFRIVRTHVLLERDKTLTQQSLLDALREGHCFIGFDVLSDTSGFSFSAGDKIMGDETTLEEAPGLKVAVPQSARIVLFKDGHKISEAPEVREMGFMPKERGTYRVEVFLDSLGKPFDRLPWIVSNPIYVK